MGKVTKEEQDKSTERLIRPLQPATVPDPFPVCPSKKMSSSQVDESVERLYKTSVEKKKADDEQLADRFYAAQNNVKLSHEDIRSSADRLCTQEMEERKKRMDESREKWLFHSNAKKKVVPHAEFVQHMYNDRIEHEKETEKKSYEKYIAATEIQSAHVSQKRIADASERLSKRE